ncbi:MAG: GNAT family N-acetyltransferase [Eubacterium sp.]
MNEIRLFEYLHPDSAAIRRTVFMEEQGFSNEFDETDGKALHLVLYKNGKAAATARMFTENSGKSYHLGRIAVLKEYRGMHLGAEIVTAMCEKARQLGAEKCELSAQCRVKEFYKALGFTEVGEIYYDEFCPHIYMEELL